MGSRIKNTAAYYVGCFYIVYLCSKSANTVNYSNTRGVLSAAFLMFVLQVRIIAWTAQSISARDLFIRLTNCFTLLASHASLYTASFRIPKKLSIGRSWGTLGRIFFRSYGCFKMNRLQNL